MPELSDINKGLEPPQLTELKLTNRPESLTDDDVLTKAEIQALLPTSISNLSLSNSQILEVGTQVNPSPITWDEEGAPLNLLLNDSDGTMSDISVSGGTYAGSQTYNHATNTTVTWSLSGDNVDTITSSKYWVYPSYWGVNTDGIPPTDTEVQAGTKLIQRTNSQFEADIVTLSNEFAWVAVEQAQSQSPYNTWIVDDSAVNRGPIEVGSFIEPVGNVTIGARTYNLYMFDQAKPFDNQLTLT